MSIVFFIKLYIVIRYVTILIKLENTSIYFGTKIYFI